MNAEPKNETMLRGRGRTPVLKLGALAGVLAAVAAGVALAATPKPGAVLTGVAAAGHGGPAYDLTFKVKSEGTVQKVIAVSQKADSASKGDCLAPDNFSFKRVKVDDDGSFKDRAVGYMYKARLEGKFKSPTKATGTIHACTPGMKFTVTK